MQLKGLEDYQLKGKRIVLRSDMNVPLKDGIIVSSERIDRSLPTIKYILKEGGKLVLLSHFGRPRENGKFQKEFSLKPVVDYLEKKLNREIPLVQDLDSLDSNREFSVVENIRFFIGEKSNDSNLAQKLGSLCDLYVLDAFATSHRAHASTTGVVDFVDQACIGFLVREELEGMRAIDQAKTPSLAILGGAKISTKLSLISSLADKVDYLLLGGGIANTCLASKGIEVGSSLVEPSLFDQAKKLVEKENILIPERVIVASKNKLHSKEVHVESLNKEDSIFDISPLYIDSLKKLFREANTIIWNGPMGLFEDDKYFLGTKAVADLISTSDAYSVIGGGDTIAAVSKLGILDSINYVSTAGGAFLKYLEGKALPALSAIEKKSLKS